MSVTRMPTDGPDMALFRVARKIGARYSQAFVVQAIASHPRPTSLLALVEVARGMGLKTTAAKADASGLSTLPLPTVVHFDDPSGEGGFGVLEGVSADTFEIWDSVNGRRAIPREVFLSRWSGVVVMIEPSDERAPTEHRYLRQRLLEIVGGGTSTPALADGAAAPFLRAVMGALLAVLVVGAVVVLPSAARLPAVLLVVIALLGVVLTLVMAVSVTERDNPLANRICRRGKLVDCHGVLTSRYSRVFGFPLSDVGLAFYGAMVLLIVSAGPLDPPGVWGMMTVAFTATVPFALLLVAIQISMKQFCTLCMATHAVNVAGAVIAWTMLWEAAGGRLDLLLFVWFLLLFGLMLFVVTPYFRRSRSLRAITDRHRRIVASPFGTLAHFLSESTTEVTGAASGVELQGSSGAHEIVLFVHPGCGKCLPALRELLDRAQVVPLKVFIGAAPKDPLESDRRACTVLTAAWMVAGGDRIIDAYSSAKKHLPELGGPRGVSILAEDLSVDRAAVERAIGIARRLVERAELAVDQHAEGTPAFFLDSRPYEGPLSHLGFLVQKHPELLRSAR